MRSEGSGCWQKGVGLKELRNKGRFKGGRLRERIQGEVYAD